MSTVKTIICFLMIMQFFLQKIRNFDEMDFPISLFSIVCELTVEDQKAIEVYLTSMHCWNSLKMCKWPFRVFYTTLLRFYTYIQVLVMHKMHYSQFHLYTTVKAFLFLLFSMKSSFFSPISPCFLNLDIAALNVAPHCWCAHTLALPFGGITFLWIPCTPSPGTHL